MSGKVCEKMPVNDEGDRGSSECALKPVDEKIRHQMYALTTLNTDHIALVSQSINYFYVFCCAASWQNEVNINCVPKSGPPTDGSNFVKT